MNPFEEPEEEIVGDLAISRFLSDRLLMPRQSLCELSGDTSLADPSQYPSGLVKRVAKAWVVPLAEITCAQVRVLVGQKFGLEWLARPVALFVAAHPQAECDLYPGDLTCGTLAAAGEMLQFAPAETRAMLATDFGWMDGAFAFDADGTLLRETKALLTEARRLADL
jgi:hypothetical protein